MSTVKKTPRRVERVLAFKVLYGLCFNPASDLEALRDAFSQLPDKPEDLQANFAWELAEGVWRQQKTLDETITSFSQNWRIDRMGKVELTLLRLAIFELLFRQDIPARVIMNEAIELSKQFGDDKSRSFVNGILDAAAKAIENGRLK